jgi:hypothetical protein
LQSGKPAASGGFVAEPEVEPAPVELVLLPLMLLVLLPEVVLGVSLRTCFVTLSQHFMLPGAAALGEVVVVDVCAVATPIVPASIAAAINAVPVIRMQRILSELQISLGVLRRDVGQREDGAARSALPRDKKRTSGRPEKSSTFRLIMTMRITATSGKFSLSRSVSQP